MNVTIPTIHTDRLVLRGPKIEDFEPLCAYFQDPRSAFNGGPLGQNEVWGVLLKNMGQWHLLGHGLWHITEAGADRYIGFAGIFNPRDWPEPELGYGIMAGFEGKGLASEAVIAARSAAATHFGFDHLPSYIAPNNARSKALAERTGAVFEAEIELRGDTAHLYRHPKQEAA